MTAMHKTIPETDAFGIEIEPFAASGLHKSGTPVGSFLGKPIFPTITGQNGTWTFTRIARFDSASGDSLLKLAEDEILIAPALVYRRVA